MVTVSICKARFTTETRSSRSRICSPCSPCLRGYPFYDLLTLPQIPLQYLLAGPEHDVVVASYMSERVAGIPQAVRRAHDVGVQDQRHHACAAACVAVELREL